jgi:gliding motility-associated-like protein
MKYFKDLNIGFLLALYILVGFQGIKTKSLSQSVISTIGIADFLDSTVLTETKLNTFFMDTGIPFLGMTLQDNDGDGIEDLSDLDDDNDGILDTDECLNLLTQSGFDNVSGLSNGNNFDVSISPWINTSGRPNIVQVDGAGGFDYGNAGPLEDANVNTGAGTLQRYLDFVSGSGDFYQEFTLSSLTSVTYSGYFSSRDDRSGIGGLHLTDTNGTVLDATGNITINSGGDSENSKWKFISKTHTLPAGTYRFVVSMGDYGNFDEGGLYVCADTDEDGIIDSKDLDADNDGIYDLVEMGNGILDANKDGIIDGSNINSGTNGLFDGIETVVDNGAINYALKDSDNDGILDSIELDSDNDSCNDVIEAGFIDQNDDGELGDTAITFDSNGKVTSSVDGYSTPFDGDLDMVFDFQELGAPLSIITQPTDHLACENTVVSFEVITSNDLETTYQWQENMGTVWNNIVDSGNYIGSNTNTLSIANTSVLIDGFTYRVKISNEAYKCDTDFISEEAAIQINPLPDEMLAVGNATICFGETTSIILSNSQLGIEYQLRLDSDNSFVDTSLIGTGGDLSFQVTPTATTIYNVLATNTTLNCNLQLLNKSTITVNRLPIDNLVFNSETICFGDSINLTLKNSEVGIQYQLRLENDNSNRGIPIMGTGANIIFNIAPSVTTTYYVLATNTTTNCSIVEANKSIVTVHPLPIINTVVDLKQCDDNTDGISLFNLTEANSLISSNSANETFTFYLTDTLAQAGLVSNQIISFTNYPNPTPLNSVVFARVENINGCYRTSRINLVVGVSQIPPTFNTLVYTVCDDEMVDGDKRNGIATFDFSNTTTIIENLFPLPRNFTITYYNNEADALAEENAIADSSNHRNDDYPNSQNIYVRIDSDVVNACLGLGHHITLNVEALPITNPITFLRQCDDVPSDTEITSKFDTSNLEADILQGQTNVNLTYFKADGSPLTDVSGTLITSPFPNSFRTASQIITVRAVNTLTNTTNNIACDDEITIAFIVDETPIANPIVIVPVCDDGFDDTDGLHEFDTSTIETTLLGSQTGMVVSYFDGNNEALPSPLPNPFNSATQSITVTVENPINTTCIATTTFDLIVNSLPEFTVDTPRIICESGPASTITLDVYQDDLSEVLDYSWADVSGKFISSSQAIDVTSSGTYFVTLTKTDGTNCSRTREIFVVYSEKATITLDDITIVDDSDNNTITINNNLGQGDYEFSLDDDFVGYQDEPYFDFVEAGIHTIYVRDKNGCGISAIEVSVIGFPKFFTPNNDGHNDTWEVKGLSPDFYPSSIILIFDRFGKILAEVNPNGVGWNGFYNGQELPSTDYWFSVQLTDKNGGQRNRKGHFSMIRR